MSDLNFYRAMIALVAFNVLVVAWCAYATATTGGVERLVCGACFVFNCVWVMLNARTAHRVREWLR